MVGFPGLPGWDGIHPAIVMFPVVLLLVTPLLLLASLFARGAWRTWAGAALLTMVLGTLAAWFAVDSGHAAGQLVDKSKALEGAILRHEALGTLVRNVFTLLTLVYAALYLAPLWLRRTVPDALRIGLYAAFLVAFAVATGLVARAADAGGRLVHEHGLQAYVVAPAAPAPAAATPAEATAPETERHEPAPPAGVRH